MKAIYQIILIVLVTTLSAVAQEVKGLKIGDKVPDITMDHLLRYKSASAKLSDFKGKLILIDFWGTHCIPCIKLLPRLDSIQSKLKDRIVIIPVSDEPRAKVESTLNRLPSLKHLHLPMVYQDTILKKLFPHYTAPHEVIIDGDGIVKAITSEDNITEQTITDFLNRKNVNVYIKKTIKGLNGSKPLFMEDKGQKPLYYFILTARYDSTISAQSAILDRENEGASRIYGINLPLLGYYRYALYKHNSSANSFPDNRIVLNVKDSSRFIPPVSTSSYKWLRSNSYCLDLVVPVFLRPKIFDCLKEELDRNFQLSSKVEIRQVKCYAIKTLNDKMSFKSKTNDVLFDQGKALWTIRNVPLSNIVEQINLSSEFPIVNETGYNGKVDMQLTPKFKNIAVMKKELNAFGLTIEETYKDLAMIVLSDNAVVSP